MQFMWECNNIETINASTCLVYVVLRVLCIYQMILYGYFTYIYEYNIYCVFIKTYAHIYIFYSVQK